MENGAYVMIGFRNSGLLLLLAALCLALLATCTSETEVPRPTAEATATPTQDQRAGTASPVRVVETATPSLPDEIRSLELKGYLSAASIWTFDLHGDLAYVGQGRMLSIVRHADPARPQRVGYVVLHDAIRDVATARDPSTGRVYAYLALGDGGLAVVDASDPVRPVVVNTNLEGQRVNAVAVYRAHLYVSAGALYVMEPFAGAGSELAEIAEYRPVDAIGRPGQVIAVSGGRAYVLYHNDSSRADSLRIVDVSEPTVPSEMGVYRAGVPIRDGAVVGDYAFLLVGEGVPYLVGVDLSDPARPMVGQAEEAKTWLGQRVDAVGQTLYLAGPPSNGGLGYVQILDVTEPTHPIALGRYEGVSAAVAEILASDGLVLLAADDSLVFVDVAVPNAPAVTGRFESQKLPSIRRGLAVVRDHVYIAAGLEGLWVVDVSDAANPRIVGSYDTAGHAWNVALWEGHAYVADEQGGLRVIDVRDPAHPAEVGDLVPPGSSTFFGDLAIGVQPSSGRVLAYVADAFPGETGLCVVDISDPSAPRQVGRLPLGRGMQGDVRVYGLAVAGELAYLGVGAAGLRIVDVSDPSLPVEVGALDVPGRADDLVVADDRVYLVDGDLRIVDVSDPSSPQEVGFYDVPSLSPWPYVAVNGRYAFLTAQGTRVLDVSEPAAPTEVAGHPLGQGALTVDDGRIYVLGDGLSILRASDQAASRPAATPTPGCTDYTAEVSLSATDTQPYVGEVVTVTAMLTNRGCGMLGLPRYSLHVDTEGDKPLFAALPEAVVHHVGISSGHSDAAEFPLRAVRTGEATLTAGVSFEFHAGYPGPGYWGGRGGGPLQITVRPPDAGSVPEGDRECLAVPEVAITVCLPGGYSASRSAEQNRRGSLVSYDLEPAEDRETPYLAELQFFTEASIGRFIRDCGSDYPCFFGDYPDLDRYSEQREALVKLETLDGYDLTRFGDRAFLVSVLPCYGDTCLIREYTTFVGEIKFDVWAVLENGSQMEESDRLLGRLSISAGEVQE
jgi:hypothetical protein